MHALFICLSLFITITLQGQNPQRFQQEVDSLIILNKSFNKHNVILFTGSSSIRLWHDLQSSFPNSNILNMGFGGSKMADLLYYTDRLIIPYRPKQIFIYEGDNDINSGRSDNQIIASADSILLKIRKHLPEAEVVFISAKPSLSRWGLKEKYEAYNKKLKSWTEQKRKVRYMDVWTPMLDAKGEVLKDIFVEDGLHLNKKGYAIWTNVLRKYIPRVSK